MRPIQRVTSLLVIAGLALASPVHAQVLERARGELLVAVGTAAFETLTLPALYTLKAKPPSDGLLVLAPSLTVAVTSRVQVGASIAGAIAFNPAAPLAGLPYSRSGIGDARLFVAGVLAGERRFSPSVQLTAFGSAETATLPHLAGPQVAGTQILLYKVVRPRFRVGGTVSISDDVREPTGWTMKPIRASSVMVEFGLSRASTLSVDIAEVTGGERLISDRRLAAIRDLQATITVTRWNEGRPRVSLVMSGVGLTSDEPFFLVGVRFALFSVRNARI